ncbi:MAG: ribonuclease HII [Nanoarchaeota archaeon]
MYLIGIDDAGRGPLLGPMFLAGVLIKSTDEKFLKELGAKDSKLLTHPQRIILAEQIRKNAINIEISESSPKEIDEAVNSINLNTLEAKMTANIINKLNNKKDKIRAIVDCPSVNTLAWKNKMLSFVKNKENLEVRCEHKADFNYPVVSAASIIAKVAREDSVEKIKKQFGNIGSGYPSDPTTIEFIKSQGKALADTGIVRTSWATWKNLYPQASRKSSQNKLF